MMRITGILVALCLLASGGWYLWQRTDHTAFTDPTLAMGEFRTLEIRHTAEEVMQTQKAYLLKQASYTFLEPKLLFYPYLCMDVKYAKAQGETGEGTLLWGLEDGEMVIHTGTWEKTHGFEDCLAVNADKHDFHIIDILLRNGGSVDKEKFYQQLHTDPKIVERWLQNCQEKKLIVTQGNKFRLHFQTPKMQTSPVTTLDQPLVAQPTKHSHKIRGRYSPNQIKRLAETAFGDDFAIRKTEVVFLPVIAILVQNPDGSILTTYWNALNGKRFDTSLCR
jgi:hypothetical protein